MNKLLKIIHILCLLNVNKLWTNTSVEEKPFDIIIPSYNNKNWYQKNLGSVFAQKYSNFRIIYIDDCSTDGTADLVEEYTKKIGFQSKMVLIRNQQNIKALANIYKAILNLCPDNHIVLILDGDDWLMHDHVLSIINKTYNDPNTWLTYGSYIDIAENDQCCGAPCHAITAEDINTTSRNMCANTTADITRNFGKIAAFRSGWMPGHPRTFFAGLFKHIALKDLFSQGLIALSAYDIAIGWPLLEMAQHHFSFIDQVLYGHNVNTPLSDDKVNHYLQKCVMYDMESKASYVPLNSIFEKNQSENQISLFAFVDSINSEQNNTLLHSITSFSPEIKSVYFVHGEKILTIQNNIGDPESIEKLQNISRKIANLPCNYVLISCGNIFFDKPTDLEKRIQLLETTKSYNYSLLNYTNKSTLIHHLASRHTPLDSCNAYQFSHSSGILANPQDTAMTLYRKKDILTLLANAQTINSFKLLHTLGCCTIDMRYEVGLF